MARPLRIEFPGALYHVTSRGDKKRNIFRDDSDREKFLFILGSVVERYNWVLHAYCLMNNHYHLLVETPNGNLSLGMRQLNGVYTQAFNRAHHTVGHLFQGRYKAILVDRDSYLLELCRYIVLNPVRAGFVNKVWQWRWSSYRATAGIDKKPKFLTTKWILSQFSQTQGRAQSLYETFVQQGIGKESPFNELKGRIILGKDRFIEKIREHIEKRGQIGEVSRVERFATRLRLDEIFEEGIDKGVRDRKIYIAHVRYGYKLKEIADYLGIHYSTVSKALKRYQESKNSKIKI